MDHDVVIAGSGPAGLSAALAAAEAGKDVVLLERLDKLGLKLLASGGGRCNLGNALPAADFMASFGRSGRFMEPALKLAPPEWVRGFLEAHGVPSVAEDGFHFFPKSGRAGDVLEAFASECRRLSVGIRPSTRLLSAESSEGLFKLRTDKGELNARTLILATGGTAWPALGGCPYGLELARSFGHSVVKPLPAMAPVIIADAWVRALSGVSLPDSRLSISTGKRTRFESSGELLFTHEGLSGPAALDISGDVAAACDAAGGPVELTLQVKPGWGQAEWKAEIDSWRNKDDARKIARTLLARLMPRSLADALCEVAACPDVKACELKAEERDRLAKTLGEAVLKATGSGPMQKAMAMKGGVSLKEVAPATLESKLVQGLFFAGELLDLVGPCGGYNIQWAFSSGRLAGSSAAKAIA